jgi:hypothetical protein
MQNDCWTSNSDSLVGKFSAPMKRLTKDKVTPFWKSKPTIYLGRAWHESLHAQARHRAGDGLASGHRVNLLERYDYPAHVPICLERDGHRVQATVEDDGKAFDPFSLGTPDIDAGLDDRAVGGLGVHLVKELMDEFDYRFIDGRNHVHLAKTLQG